MFITNNRHGENSGVCVGEYPLGLCHSVLYGTSDVNIKNLQRVQNSLARVVSCTRRAEHISPALMQLHWLSVRQRIQYKLAALTYTIRMTR